AEIEQVNKNPKASEYIPQQEKGIRPACVLPYELYINDNFDKDKKDVELNLKAGNTFFKNGEGAPFIVHAKNYGGKDFIERSYAVSVGDSLKDSWQVNDFKDAKYHLEAYGPNGFYRKFKGSNHDLFLNIFLGYEAGLSNTLTGNIVLNLRNNDDVEIAIEIIDNAYKTALIKRQLNAKTKQTLVLDLSKSYGWYDISVKIAGNMFFEKRYAGHVETGKESKSDPAMGDV
ncbi:MAG: phospholipase domain-containing protein, partial [Parafilimonas sp.]